MTEIKHAYWYESWYETICPYCNVHNWHCNGNEEDLSGIDVDSIECWRCVKIYWFGEPLEDISSPENTFKGVQKP